MAASCQSACRKRTYLSHSVQVEFEATWEASEVQLSTDKHAGSRRPARRPRHRAQGCMSISSILLARVARSCEPGVFVRNWVRAVELDLFKKYEFEVARSLDWTLHRLGPHRATSDETLPSSHFATSPRSYLALVVRRVSGGREISRPL